MDGKMDERADACMDGRMDHWMDVRLRVCVCMSAGMVVDSTSVQDSTEAFTHP